MTYRVMCRVSGGVTGTREAFLKHDGQIVEFSTFEDAQKKAVELDKRNNTMFACAHFMYWVVDDSHDWN